MHLPRSLTTPIVLTLVAISAISAFLSYTLPDSEQYRQYAKGTASLPKPRITSFVFALHSYSVALPVIAFGLAWDVLRRRSCTARRVLWYTSFIVTVSCLWTAAALLGVYLVDPVFVFGRLR